MPARINQTDVILNLNIMKPSASVRMQTLLAVQPPSPRSSTIHHPRPSPSYGHSLYFISFLGLCLHQVKWLFLCHRSVFIKVVRYLVPLRAFCSHKPDSLSAFLIHWEEGSIAYDLDSTFQPLTLSSSLSLSLPDNPLRSIFFTGPSPIKICHRDVCNKEIALNDRSAFYCMFLFQMSLVF